MFTPDFSKITPEVAVSALGQACFSIGIGNAIMITYGSYLPRNVSIPKAAVGISVVDTLVAITAGLAIFPIVFANNLDFNAGAGIFFQTLPTALAEYWYIGAAFFFLAFFAAITSSVSLLEPSVAYVPEKFNLTKKKAAWITGSAITALGLMSLFSPKFFDFIDTGLAGPILAPLSALLIVLFTGWRLKKTIIEEELRQKDADESLEVGVTTAALAGTVGLATGTSGIARALLVLMGGDGVKLGRFILFFVRFIAPIFMGIVLILGTYTKWIAPLLGG